ncbi:MAG: pectinesterase family protein [Hungatella sp.]
MIRVSQHGDGDFSTVSAAIDSIPEECEEEVTILILPGIYKEKLTIRKSGLTLLGTSAATTILTYGDYGRMEMEDGSRRGTFRTASVFLDASDLTIKNLTFENSAGSGPDIGQALALYVDGDRIRFDHCRILGGQDTLFTGPLPPSPMIPDGFIGPKEHAPRVNGRHYYHQCLIRGDIDFIFGSATAYFDQCELFSENHVGEEVKGYVTAASTPEGQPYGYVFSDCRFTGDCPAGTVYLGRPWRNYAKTVLLRCEIGAHIKTEGWFNWNKPEAEETIFYAEYQSFGLGASTDRASYVRQLTDAEAADYTKEQVLGDWIKEGKR